jgi:hypothetical protein
MSDAQALELIKFILFRFVGAMPEDHMLRNAIADWKQNNSIIDG